MSHVLNAVQATKAMLYLHFDVDQTTSSLSYELVRDSSNAPDPQPKTGPHADSLSFVPGEALGIEIAGYGPIHATDPSQDFVSFQVVDCAIVTRPQVIQCGQGLDTAYAVPSPFQQALGACYPLALDFSASASGLETGRRAVTQTWKRTLDIGLTPGIWKLSMVLTVRITRGVGIMDEVRVLSFDPETEVGGNGTMTSPPPHIKRQ
jgi:hypothetical protein